MGRIASFPLVGVASLIVTSCGENTSHQTVVLTGSSTVAPIAADAARRYETENPGIRVGVQSGGSSRGIADVMSGLADLGMISRALKPGESELTATRIAMDGVCVIVNSSNPVSDLTKRQLVDIYSGKVENWKELGGADGEIVVASKAEGRATLEVFLGYTGLDSADIAADVIVGENQHAIKTVSGNAHAIGYVSIGAAASEADAGTPIKLVACDGVAPTTESVADGMFPITRPLQVVSHGELKPPAKAFLEYLRSSEINDIVEDHLYVPVSD